MPVNLFQKKGVFVEKYFGTVSIVDIQMTLQAKKALTPKWVLSDLTSSKFEFPYSVIVEMAEENKKVDSIKKYAIVVEDKVSTNYGNAMMYQFLSHHHDWDTQIFFDTEQANEWLSVPSFQTFGVESGAQRAMP